MAAAYILWMLQRVVYGAPATHMTSKLYDLNWCEMGMLIPLVGFVFWIGLYPKPVLDIMHATVDHLVQQEVRVMTVDGQPAHDSLTFASADPHALVGSPESPTR